MSDGDPNPYIDPGPFGEVIIGDMRVECHLVEIDGCSKEEDWNVQKGTKSKGGTASWKGTKVAEKVKLKWRASTAAEYAAMGDLYTMMRPRPGEKPPTFHIINPVVNWGGIGEIALKAPPQPKWLPKEGAWEFDWEFIEYDPTSDAKTGKADPPKPPEDSKDPPTAQSEADKKIAALNREIDKL